ncbi:hypothetical protein [Mesorhizobium sp. J8]|nr:hypothetical protein [Mesorhizobium sp. J8]
MLYSNGHYLNDAVRDSATNLRDFLDSVAQVSSFDHGKSGDRQA